VDYIPYYQDIYILLLHQFLSTTPMVDKRIVILIGQDYTSLKFPAKNQHVFPIVTIYKCVSVIIEGGIDSDHINMLQFESLIVV